MNKQYIILSNCLQILENHDFNEQELNKAVKVLIANSAMLIQQNKMLSESIKTIEEGLILSGDDILSKELLYMDKSFEENVYSTLRNLIDSISDEET